MKRLQTQNKLKMEIEIMQRLKSNRNCNNQEDKEKLKKKYILGKGNRSYLHSKSLRD